MSKAKDLEHKRRLKKAREESDLVRDMPKHPNKKLNITLPIAPSINSAFWYINGKPVPKKETKTYILNTKKAIQKAIKKQNWAIPSRGTWLYFDMVVYMPDRLRRDSHNTLKILLDCFSGISWYDDYFILPRINMVRLDKENPRMCIQVHYQKNKDIERYDSAIKKAFD